MYLKGRVKRGKYSRENHEETIEVFVDYKSGKRTLDTACRELYRLAGLEPKVSEALLETLKRLSVKEIRSFWLPEYERLIAGKKTIEDK